MEAFVSDVLKGNMADSSISASQVLAFVGSALFKVVNPDVAQNALVSSLKEHNFLGLEQEECLAVVKKLRGTQPTAAKAGPASGAKRKGGGDDEEAPAKKARQPRGISVHNFFTTHLFDVMHKDSSFPKLQVPGVTTDAEGKTVEPRGARMVMVNQVWKVMSEQDKAKYNEVVGGFLESVNQAIKSGGERDKDKLLSDFQSYLESKKLTKEMKHLLVRTAKAAQAAEGAPASGKAAPAAANGAASGKAQKKDAKTATPAAPAKAESSGSEEEEEEEEGGSQDESDSSEEESDE